MGLRVPRSVCRYGEEPMINNDCKMRTLSFFLLFTIFYWALPTNASAQCTNNNTVIAGGAITPPCPGSMIVPCVNAGQYALVNVTTGYSYEFGTCNATYNTYLTVLNNASGATLVYNNDDEGCTPQSVVVWTATFTGQVRVLVDRYVNFGNPCAHSGGCAPVSISCLPSPPAVSNNECAGATTLMVLPSCYYEAYSNVGATNSPNTPNPSCNYTNSARDVWFSFTAPTSGAVVIRAQAYNMDPIMQLYSGTCGSLVRVECDDDDGPGVSALIDRRCTRLTPGGNYFIRVWGYGSSTGTFGLCVEGYDTFNTPMQDCSGGFTLCSSGSVNNSSDYSGCSADLTTTNAPCLLNQERQGTWYFFSPQSTGDISFTITPLNALGQPDDVDFDFAVWGPLSAVVCPPTSPAARCSYAQPPATGPWATGLQSPSTNTTENQFGTGFLRPLSIGPAEVGRVYMLYVDNFNRNGQGFNLTWGLASAGQLDCTLLPIAIIDLTAEQDGEHITVKWTAQDIAQNDLFIVERSSNGLDFLPIGSVPASPGSSNTTNYLWHDMSPFDGMNYYRLSTRSIDGTTSLSSVVRVALQRNMQSLIPIPNPANSTVHFHMNGMEDADGIDLRVYDSSGRIVSALHHPQGTSVRSIVVSVADLEPGYYLVSLLDALGNPLGTGRFVKE